MKCNSSKGLLKRFIPFFLTFVVGLVIASFFIPVAAPNLQFGRGKRQHRAEDEQIRMENQRLRLENYDLKMELKQAREASMDWNAGELPLMDVPPPPPPPVPAIPAAPAKAPAPPRR